MPGLHGRSDLPGIPPFRCAYLRAENGVYCDRQGPLREWEEHRRDLAEATMFRTRHAGAFLGFVFAAVLAACDPTDGSRHSSDPTAPPPHSDPTQPPAPSRGELPPDPPGRGPGEGPSAPPPPVPEPGTV